MTTFDLRRDGSHCRDFQVTHPLRARDLAEILTMEAREIDTPPGTVTGYARLSQKAARTLVAAHLVEHGGSAHPYWTERLGHEDLEARAEWAAETVARVWPDANAEELAAHVRWAKEVADRGPW